MRSCIDGSYDGEPAIGQETISKIASCQICNPVGNAACVLDYRLPRRNDCRRRELHRFDRAPPAT